MKYKTKSSDETRNLGKEFAVGLVSGDTLLFFGNLGAGKTTFIQGLAEGLGVKDRILSPTFVLQRSYEVSKNEIKKLHHIDLYRLEGKSEIISLGLFETVNDLDSIVLIEWAEKLNDFKPKKGYKIYLNYLSDSEREIEIEKF